MAIAADKIESRSALASLLEEHGDKLLACVHCGLCLPACPTYRELGNENDSPRGRVYLMRSVAEGRMQIGDAFITHIDQCLGCRACEPACPSGVPYGQLLEAARVQVSEAKSARRSATEFMMRLMLNQVFTRPRLLRFAMSVARWMRDSGFAKLLFEGRMFSGRLHFALALLLSSRSPFSGKEKISETVNQVEAKGQPVTTKVALLRGCVMEGLFGETNRATERVLERNSCEVVEASGQMCCGALHAHSGQIEQARELARKNIEAFEASGCEFVIVNAAGCGAAMKDYKELFEDDKKMAERARQFSSKVKDVSEFLAERGIEPPQGRVEDKVAYDAPCHLIHAQRIAQAPVELLKSISGLNLVPLRGSEHCCGGAGIYNLQHTELSGEILEDKIDNIRASGARAVVTANPGCIMQIGAGALTSGLDIDVVHPIELIDAAYNNRQIEKHPR
jgi:glycolate oxidase iron-sulfur subunit